MVDDGSKNNSDEFVGFVEVCIHQAREIHNICIYQNQDVYAKFCSTSNPEPKISTKVINQGGRNPVFNDTLNLSFRKLDSSLRCEIWMLSRVRNYLEDQFLGFTSVPLFDIISDESGNSPREFELSLSEILHSHAGFVELSFNYSGITSYESHSASVADVAHEQNVSCDLDRIKFPNQETVNENGRMVSEHLRFPCDRLDPPVQGVSCPLGNDDNDLSSKGGSCPLGNGDNNLSSKGDSCPLENDHNDLSSKGGSCPLGNGDNNLSSKGGSCPIENDDNSLGSEGGSCPLSCVEIRSLETGDAEKRYDHKSGDGGGGGGDGGEGISGILPLVVSVETKETVVQEEIVDMYMKGMQQFTDALAKMKLPMDTGDRSKVEKDDGKTENNQASPDGKTRGSKSPDRSSPKVFYGSGAFF